MKFSSFGQIASSNKIDIKNGVIHGVSVITIGEASGHDMVIDTKTLEQVKEQASQFSDGLKVRMNHPKDGEGTIQSIIGSLKNFRIEGKQVRADLYLLKSDANFDKIIELAQTQAENFGLSIVFSGKSEQEDDVKLARCTEIYACDLVDSPAANPTGLFSKIKKPFPNLMNDEQKKLAKALGLSDDCTLEKLNETLTAMGVTSFAAKVKYKKGDSGDHADDCKCQMCMSKGKDDDTADQKMSAKLTELLAPFKTEFEALKADKANMLALSQKAQIETLCAEASRDGKVIPFEKDDLYTEKDGKLTILQTPEQLSKVIAKLQPTVKLAKPTRVEPKGADGKPIQIFGRNKTKEQIALVREFSERQRELNAPVIGQHIKRLHMESADKQTMN
jgi:hypothetical protein